MVKVLIVRHGKAAASYTENPDPGLDETGHAQAKAVAKILKQSLPLKIISSPLKRAIETAGPLLSIQGGELDLEPRVSEIRSPGLSLTERGPWLQKIMQGKWSEQADDLRQWRQQLVDCITGQKEDCVIFSHFVAINVVTGYADNRDEVNICRPDNTSITEFETDGTSLALIRRGDDAETKIN
jgi:broad specificity phosphatase PhoE